MLKLQFKNGDHVWVVDKSFSIGSAEDNSLVLDNASVSPQHARILSQDDEHLLRDLSSSKGTKVNGKPVAQQNIRHNDVLQLGEITLKVIDPYHEDNKQQAWTLVASSGWLSGQEFPVVSRHEHALIKIGRSSHCDIILPGTHLSREHAELRIEGGLLRVKDLDSANGTYINDSRITNGVVRPGDRLRLDVYSFIVVGPHMYAYRRQNLDFFGSDTKMRPAVTSAEVAAANALAAEEKAWKTRSTSPGNRDEGGTPSTIPHFALAVAGGLLVCALSVVIYIVFG